MPVKLLVFASNSVPFSKKTSKVYKSQCCEGDTVLFGTSQYHPHNIAVELLNGDDAYGEAYILISITKTGTWHTCDTSFFKEREGIFALTQFAPVIDSGIIINIDLREQGFLGIETVQPGDE